MQVAAQGVAEAQQHQHKAPKHDGFFNPMAKFHFQKCRYHRRTGLKSENKTKLCFVADTSRFLLIILSRLWSSRPHDLERTVVEERMSDVSQENRPHHPNSPCNAQFFNSKPNDDAITSRNGSKSTCTRKYCRHV